MKNKKICVVGSLNIDLTVSMERFHQPGETVTAISTGSGLKDVRNALRAAGKNMLYFN